MSTSRAVVRTQNASRYLQQLCKHWAHKFETEFTPLEGRVALPLGSTRLRADDVALTIDLEVSRTEDLAQMEEVIQRHVERFAFRETLAFEWTREV